MHAQEARAVHSFENMEAVVTVSDPVTHLIRAYKACRWAVFVVAFVALLAYPAAMIPAKLLARRLYTVPGAHPPMPGTLPSTLLHCGAHVLHPPVLAQPSRF